MNMFKNKTDKYLRMVTTHWTVDKPMTSLSTCYLGLSTLDGNLVKTWYIIGDIMYGDRVMHGCSGFLLHMASDACSLDGSLVNNCK